MKTEAPHFSYPKRDRYFADTKRMGRAPEAPMDVDVPTLPFDWTETQGDLAPAIRTVTGYAWYALAFGAGWFASALYTLAALKGWM